MIKFLVFLLIFLMSCTPVITEDDLFKTGKEVKPPYGCIELRKRGGEC